MKKKALLFVGLAGCALDPAMAGQAASPPPVSGEGGGSYEEEQAPEIVVTGAKPRGSVLGNIPPEVVMSPAEIQSYGVSSITELLTELAPQTTGSDGSSGPVILLSGRRIANFSEIRSIPTEAIERVEILPEEVALKYGYRPGQKVMNIVLRQRFRSVTVEGFGRMATEGGTSTTGGEGSLLHLNRDGRLNIAVKGSVTSPLYESERDILSQSPRRPYAAAGNIMAASPGAEIDPALSALAGKMVTLAGVPAPAIAGNASLGDFAALAGMPNTTDTRPYRTLLPKTSTVDINSVYNRNIGSVSATFNANVTITDTDSAQGLASTAFDVPSISPYSPFAQDVTLYRYLEEFRPLTQDNHQVDAHAGITLGGDTWGWRWSFTGNYDRSESNTRSITGPDLTLAQSAIAAGAINPFATLEERYLELMSVDRAHSVTNSGDAQLVASGSLFRMPAGETAASFKIGGAGTGIDSWSSRRGLYSESDLSRGTVSGQGSIDVPLTSRRRDVLPFLGDISANFNIAYDHLSDFGTLRQIGYGATWTPRTPVTLVFSVSHEDSAPSLGQLGGPVVVTPGVRVFDYQTGQTVDVIRTAGGNPDLAAQDARNIKLGVTFRPLTSSRTNLSLVGNYLNSRISRPIAAFPTATPQIEAAFPDRFTRDADGNLVAIDARPINFRERNRENIRWGFNFSRQISSGNMADNRGFPAPGGGGDRPSGDTQPGDAPRGEGARGEGGRGEGPPAGGPPRFGPGGPRGAMGTRLQFAVYHTWYMKDRIDIQDGGPVIDLLNGGAIDSSGGQSRHQIEVQAGLTRNGVGARLSGNWQSATMVDGGATGDLRFGSLGTIDFRLFANLGQQRSLVTRWPFLRGARLSLSVDNLFNQRMRVTDAAGDTPVSYQPAYLDAMGRSVRISFRKLFFTPPVRRPQPTPGDED